MKHSYPISLISYLINIPWSVISHSSISYMTFKHLKATGNTGLRLQDLSVPRIFQGTDQGNQGPGRSSKVKLGDNGRSTWYMNQRCDWYIWYTCIYIYVCVCDIYIYIYMNMIISWYVNQKSGGYINGYISGIYIDERLIIIIMLDNMLDWCWLL